MAQNLYGGVKAVTHYSLSAVQGANTVSIGKTVAMSKCVIVDCGADHTSAITTAYSFIDAGGGSATQVSAQKGTSGTHTIKFSIVEYY